jgi:hypothetical protein
MAQQGGYNFLQQRGVQSSSTERRREKLRGILPSKRGPYNLNSEQVKADLAAAKEKIKELEEKTTPESRPGEALGLAEKENKELRQRNRELESRVEYLTDQLAKRNQDLRGMEMLVNILKRDAGPNGDVPAVDGGLEVFGADVASAEGNGIGNGIGNGWLNGESVGNGIGNGWLNGEFVESSKSFHDSEFDAANALVCLQHSPMKQNPTQCSPNHPMPGH